MHDETLKARGRFGGEFFDETVDGAEKKFGEAVADTDMNNIEGMFSESNEEGLTHNVNGFLDEFRFYAGEAGLGAATADGGDGVEEVGVADEDLSWLEDFSEFSTPATSACVASAPVVMDVPDNGNVLLGGDSARSGDPTAAGQGVERNFAVDVDFSSTMKMTGEGHCERAPGVDVASAKIRSTTDSHSQTVPTATVNISASPSTLVVPPCKPAADPKAASSCDGKSSSDLKEKLRRQKVARYLEKKKRRVWSKMAPYKSRQRVANARPRHKGRFLPLESDFVPIQELQRRQRAIFKQMQEASQPESSPSAPPEDVM